MHQELLFIGIDMGATHCRFCIMNKQQQILATHRQKTADLLIPQLSTGIIAICERLIGSAKLARIVIGLPAAISLDQTILSVPNLAIEPQELTRLAPDLAHHFACEVRLDRDVNLQLRYDVEHYQLQHKLVIAVYLGTGMGFSVWYQGKVFIGAHGVAGELGHIPYGDPQRICACGNRACVETNCSGLVLRKWHESNAFDFPLEQVFSFQSHHPFIQDYLTKLANAISTAVNLFDPDSLILGGGVMDMADFPLADLVERIKQRVRKPLPYERLQILSAQSSCFNGAVGGAILALNGSTEEK